MFLPDIFYSTDLFFQEVQINEILNTNQESKKHGLILTTEQAKEIIESRNQTLRDHGRVELDIEVTKQIIHHFCSSSYINQSDYVSIIHDLQETFYYMKNETEDSISDQELIEIMCDFFNDSCRGSMELLQGRELEKLADQIRRENQMTDFLQGDDKY